MASLFLTEPGSQECWTDCLHDTLRRFHSFHHILKLMSDIFLPLLVLQGLIETHSPYLEELLTVLFSATVETTARFPAMKPIAVVSSLLLQDKEETPVKKELDSCR